MRRGTVALALLLAAPSLAAQSPLSLGVEFGYTVSGFTGPGAAGVTTRTGATAGAYLRMPVATWIAVQPGIFITSKGGATRVTPAGGGAPVRFDLDLVHFDLPVLLRARVPVPAGLRLVLTGGAVPSVQIGCNVELSQGGFSVLREACGAVTTTDFSAWDVAWVIGGGLAIPIERSELTVEVRRSEGLREVSEQGRFYNQAVSLLVSVPF